MRYRKGIVAFALLTLCVLLVSCDQKLTSENSITPVPADAVMVAGSSADKIALSFRITWKSYSGRGEAIGMIVDRYNHISAYHCCITLEDGDEDRETIEALLQSKSETIYVLPYRLIQYFGDKGLLADVTEPFANIRDLFYDSVWSLATVEGRIFGIPWLGHSMCLLYNKTLLDRAGADPDSITDRESFITAMQTIAEETGAGGLGLIGAESNDLSWMVNQFIYGYGSTLVSEDGKTVTVNNGNAAEALAFYRDVLGPYAQSSWREDTAVEVLDAFRNQEVAFEILGIWGVTDVIKNGAPFDVGILPLQRIGLYSEVGPLMLAIPADMSEQGKKTAYGFIRYMISKTAQEEIMKGEYSPEHDTYYPFRTPIRIDMADSQIFQIHPEYQIFIEGFEIPSIDVPVPAWQLVKDEVYAPGLHQVMTGEMTIDAFLNDVEIRGNQILREQQGMP